jgi:hypothetical protein
MSVIHFADLHGRRYAIPEAVLAAHEVHGALPEDERLTGLEVDPDGPPAAPGPPGGGPAYEWRIHRAEGGLEYVVTRVEAPAGPRQLFSGGGVTVVVDGAQVRVHAGPGAGGGA